MRWLVALLLTATIALADVFPHYSIIDINSGTVVTGSVGFTTMFMSSGNGVDVIEANVQQRVKTPGVLVNLSCITSVDPGVGKSIVLVGRTGSCGTLVDVNTFTCTLNGGSGVATCDTGVANMALANPNDCWDLKLTISPSLVVPPFVDCTSERAS